MSNRPSNREKVAIVLESTVFRGGLALGLAAWVIGAVLTFALFVLLGGANALIFAFAPLQLTLLSYSFAHLWPLVLGVESAARFTVMFFLPVFVLLVAGTVNTTLLGISDTKAGFAAGAFVAVGYLLGALLSFVFVFGIAQAGPELSPLSTFTIGLPMTGIVVPVLFGGLGGCFLTMFK